MISTQEFSAKVLRFIGARKDRDILDRLEATPDFKILNPHPSRFWREMFGDWRAQMIPQQGANQLLGVIPPAFLQTPSWQAFAAEFRGGISELVSWRLYSIKAYAAGGYTSRSFFDETEGTATNGRADTNMLFAGALPAGHMHVFAAIQVYSEPAVGDVQTVAAGTPVAYGDWYLVLFSGLSWLEVKINNKEYVVEGPLGVFPPGFGPGSLHAGAATVLENISYIQSGTPDAKSIHLIDPPIGILPVRPFSVTARWTAARAVATAGRLGVILPGWMLRAVA